MTKYMARKTVVDGITFDSRKEAARWTELRALETAGEITSLERQVRFEVCPKRHANKRARYYVADFVYEEKGRKVIEDVKSPMTRRLAVYSLKKALVQVNYPEYEFREFC